jgi:hypothetical protein
MDTVIPSLQEFSVDGTTLPRPDGGQSPFVYGAGDDSYRWCYWRKPDGWITVAPAWAEEFKNNILMGWWPLNQYGYFWLRNTYTDGSQWNVNTEPWRQIFLLGGAKEFSIEEIGVYGWHRRAPYKGVSFPQLKDGDITDYVCAQCQRKFVAQAHLVKHETIAHKEASSNNAFSRSIADAMAKAQGEFTGPFAEMFMMMQKQIENQNRMLAALTDRLSPITPPQGEPIDETEPPELPPLVADEVLNPINAEIKPTFSTFGTDDDAPSRRIKRGGKLN